MSKHRVGDTPRKSSPGSPSENEDPASRFRRLLRECSTGPTPDEPQIPQQASSAPPTEESPPGQSKSGSSDKLARQDSSVPAEGGTSGANDTTGDWRADPLGTPEEPGVEEIDSPSRPQGERTPEKPSSPDPKAQTPTAPPPPPLDLGSIPYRRRVPERDLEATRVTPAAYAAPPPKRVRRPRSSPLRFWDSLSGCGGCLIRMLILGVFGLLAISIAVLSYGVFLYFDIASSLPSVQDLQTKAAQFETTRILDRNGNLLYEILDPQAGRRSYVPLEDISPYIVAATIATEDSQFYSHPGFDALAIGRAVWQNLSGGVTVVSGASTITQQIARTLLMDPEERSQVTALRKIREVLLAAEITRRYTKDEILELYLNQNYYGNFAYGVEAAAETYFDTTADKLTLPQASFIAGLGQAPSVYDVFSNREATLSRHRQVLSLMVLTSQEQGCIFVSNSQQPICISPELAGTAAAEIESYEFTPIEIEIRFPHWVNFIRSELEDRFDAQTIYRSGFTVHTTLDPYLQQEAQRIVQEKVEGLAKHRVSTGALIAIQPSTGEILVMVGSADYYNEAIDGQVNMSISPRQPGSSIKPLTYTAAFEKGWTPATLIWDVASQFPPSGNPDDERKPYKPVNYDRRYHGPVRVRSALANSYNVPAVKTLAYVGIYDDPSTPQEDGLIAFARRVGITTLTRDDYGLSLTLGGGDVSLLEMTSFNSILANNGLRIPPVAITRIEDHEGNLVYEYETPEGEQVIQPEHAFLITSILSDNAARTPAFGRNSPLRLPFPAAAKTGTTNDFRDNWTLGYTPDVAVGVWVGNADYTPMKNTSGLTGAAPIWNTFMRLVVERLTGGQPSSFERPEGIVERTICSLSGTRPSEWCPSKRKEIFNSDQLPLPKEMDLWKEVWVDSYSLELASEECPEFAVKKIGLQLPSEDPFAVKWLEKNKQGKAWAKKYGFGEDRVFFVPSEVCSTESPRPIIAFTSPAEGSSTSLATLQIYGQAAATNEFEDWVLEWGTGYSPETWIELLRQDTPVETPDKLFDWDLTGVPNGPVTLRLTVNSTEGGSARVNLHLRIQVPTPTPTPTPTSTPSPTATPPLVPSLPPPTETPTPSGP